MMSAPAWARVVLDDLGLHEWDVAWAPRKWRVRSGYLGMCTSVAVNRVVTVRRIVVAAGLDVYEQLFTLLHEAAHAMGGKSLNHGKRWAKRFVRLAVSFGFSLAYISEHGSEDVFEAVTPDMPWCNPADPCSCNWLRRNYAARTRRLRRFAGLTA